MYLLLLSDFFVLDDLKGCYVTFLQVRKVVGKGNPWLRILRHESYG